MLIEEILNRLSTKSFACVFHVTVVPHLINSCFCFFSSLSETYCSHYERDTCVMHFRCCPEDKWYPCHKCHNEAVEKEHDNTKYLTVANDTPRGISTIPTERSSGEAEENSEPEGKRRPRLVYRMV